MGPLMKEGLRKFHIKQVRNLVMELYYDVNNYDLLYKDVIHQTHLINMKEDRKHIRYVNNNFF